MEEVEGDATVVLGGATTVLGENIHGRGGAEGGATSVADVLEEELWWRRCWRRSYGDAATVLEEELLRQQ